jgi:hypothetical protein
LQKASGTITFVEAERSKESFFARSQNGCKARRKKLIIFPLGVQRKERRGIAINRLVFYPRGVRAAK